MGMWTTKCSSINNKTVHNSVCIKTYTIDNIREREEKLYILISLLLPSDSFPCHILLICFLAIFYHSDSLTLASFLACRRFLRSWYLLGLSARSAKPSTPTEGAASSAASPPAAATLSLRLPLCIWLGRCGCTQSSYYTASFIDTKTNTHSLAHYQPPPCIW